MSARSSGLGLRLLWRSLGFSLNKCVFYAYKLSQKVSSKCIHPNYYFYCFECVHRVCSNLSSASCTGKLKKKISLVVSNILEVSHENKRIRIRIRIRIHELEAWIRGSGSGSTPKCQGSGTLVLRFSQDSVPLKYVYQCGYF
jgi:hypothetical protein